MAKGRKVRRSEERFSRNAETDLVCRLLLEKKTRCDHFSHRFLLHSLCQRVESPAHLKRCCRQLGLYLQINILRRALAQKRPCDQPRLGEILRQKFLCLSNRRKARLNLRARPSTHLIFPWQLPPLAGAKHTGRKPWPTANSAAPRKPQHHS